MVEAFTIGGGEYIVNTFNAVAAWTGGGGYKSLIRVVMVLGLIYALLSVAFTMNFRPWLNWFLGATMIYTCLMVPTVDVKVTDRINPSLAPATVANVPLGLGVIASFTSQVGDWLTRTAETVFVMPSQLNYTTNGMIYGARLFDQTRNFQIRDAEFATNLQAHYKNCVFGDVMLHQKSLTALADSKDLWTDIGPGSVARAQPWLERSGGGVDSGIITCNNAYQRLTTAWNTVINDHTRLWGRQAFPKLTDAAAEAKLRQDVPIVNAAFTGSGSDYTGTMRQNTAINAFMQARDAMAGGSGSAAIDTFATTRADIQARNTYNSIAQQAMSWVPILNIVLTVVFYAMFPVIFPLFLMPQTGVQTLKGYVTGFFYLAAWGPLYVILHMICMTRGTSAGTAVAEGGMSLANYAGIGAVNAETATIAGFMLMSVPFLAGGLARGAMGISGQATSMLAPAQNAAEAAAVEQTTGNYSYGNTSFANLTSNMRQSNQWSDAPTYSTGASSFTTRLANGASETFTPSGAVVTDVTGAMSRLPMGVNVNTGFVAETREAASQYLRAAESEEKAAARVITASHTNRSVQGTSTDVTNGSERGSRSADGTTIDNFDRNSGSTFNGVTNKTGTSDQNRISQGVFRGSNTTDTAKAHFGVGVGSGGLGGGLSPVSAGVNKENVAQQATNLKYDIDNTRTTDSGSTADDGTREEHANGTNLSDTHSTTDTSGTFARASTSKTSSLSEEEALSVAHSHEERARHFREKAQQLSQDANYAESHGLQMSENLSQELAEWYRREAATKPGLQAPGLHEVSLDGHQRQVRDGLISRFLSERQQALYAEVAPYLREPELAADVAPPPVSSAGDVRAMYHPKGLNAVPTLVEPADASPIPGQIAAGKKQLESEGEEKRQGRMQSAIGGADLQSEVNQALDKRFFHDRKLRE
jgi:conjugal transfer mating pair stabilization protein TraG